MLQLLKSNLKIAVLGEGVTGTSVRNGLKRCGFEEVPVDQADLIITSPGINPRDWPKVSVPIISEIEFASYLFAHYKQSPYLIGVTGTNGKTTVTQMIALVCNAATAGNIGKPLIDFVNSEEKADCIVVEVSSYQVEFCRHFKPEIAVLINLSPDHFERHQNMEGYYAAKAALVKQMTPSDTVIVNAKDPWVCRMAEESQAEIIKINEDDLAVADYPNPPISHRFMRLNAELAIQVGLKRGISRAEALEKLKEFKVAPHRIEPVRALEGVVYYNDSKATNPHATISALRSLEGPLQLILCGEDKQLDLEPLLEECEQRADHIFVFGALKDVIAKKHEKWTRSPKYHEVDTLESAILAAKQVAKKGDGILFSPASSSYDQFKGYEDRGNRFKAIVKGL